MRANVFFLDHRHAELAHLEGTSRCNEHEVDWGIAIVRYLLQQDYPGEQITLLSAYMEQVHRFGARLAQLAKTMPDAANVLNKVVDNYQGEENGIVIVSLVRSNNERRIGFLATPNRVNVALTRARDGLYVLGNMQCLTAAAEQLKPTSTDPVTDWPAIRASFERAGALVTSVAIRCEQHQTEQAVNKPADLAKLAPEGGCQRPCVFRRDCGHACGRQCHGYDIRHEKSQCLERCTRRCANDLHTCKKLCRVKCGQCTELVDKQLPCGHAQRDRCHLSVDAVQCRSACERKLKKCGHPCPQRCFEDCAKAVCTVKVDQLLPKCGHIQSVACHENVSDVRCTAKVTKTWPNCKHTIVDAECGQSVDHTLCPRPCGTEMACGHLCTGTCGACRNGRLHIKCDKKCRRVRPRMRERVLEGVPALHAPVRDEVRPLAVRHVEQGRTGKEAPRAQSGAQGQAQVRPAVSAVPVELHLAVRASHLRVEMLGTVHTTAVHRAVSHRAGVFHSRAETLLHWRVRRAVSEAEWKDHLLRLRHGRRARAEGAIARVELSVRR